MFIDLDGTRLLNSLNIATVQLNQTSITILFTDGQPLVASYSTQAAAANAYNNLLTLVASVPAGTQAQIVGVYPLADGIAGGSVIALAGTNLLAGSAITINGNAPGVTNFLSGNTVEFTSPANPAGTYDVVYTGTDGQVVHFPGFVYS